jgi:hypothetical protein
VKHAAYSQPQNKIKRIEKVKDKKKEETQGQLAIQGSKEGKMA